MCLATWQLCVNCNKRIQTTAQPRPVRWPWLGAARRYVLELLAICLCCEWQQWREQCRHSLLIRRNTPSLCNSTIVPLLIRTTRHMHEVWRAAGQQTGDCIRVGTLGTIISYSYEQQHIASLSPPVPAPGCITWDNWYRAGWSDSVLRILRDCDNATCGDNNQYSEHSY